MSSATSKPAKTVAADKPKIGGITWGPWSAIIVVVAVYFAAQLIAAQLASLYPVFKHWTSAQATNWITNSVVGQFLYVLLAEALTILLIWLFVRWRRGDFKSIGLHRPKIIEDILFALSGLAIYFPTYIVAVSLLSAAIPDFNVSQQQAIGFNQVSGPWQMTLTFVSLVVLPPIAEEIMFRGFLYSGLKKAMPVVWAAIGTSLLFAAPHLLESSGGGLLWIAGVDTFILSLVLCWLRQKTGRLYAGMGLHALKNFIAFASLFIFHLH